MGQIKCSSNDCDKPAVFRYCWTDFKFACEDCMKRVLWLAEGMGFTTPASTIERLPEEAVCTPDA